MSRIVFGLTPNAEATEVDEGTNFASVLGFAICFMWYIVAAACAVKTLRAVRDLSRRGNSVGFSEFYSSFAAEFFFRIENRIKNINATNTTKN